MIWNNSKLITELTDILNDNTSLKDIIIFGSIIRGNYHPKDIDIMIIFNDIINKQLEREVRHIFEKEFKKVSIISKNKQSILDPSFDARESALFEGKSIIDKKTLGEKYGFSSSGMFKYNFEGWSNSKKVKFYHAINGRRDQDGIFKKLECIKLANKLALVPLKNIDKFKSFLESWDINYKYIPTMIPTRLNRNNILTRIN